MFKSILVNAEIEITLFPQRQFYQNFIREEIVVTESEQALEQINSSLTCIAELHSELIQTLKMGLFMNQSRYHSNTKM